MSTARDAAGVIDLSAARAFIDALAGTDSPVTFQTFPERNGANCRPMVKHGSLSKHGAALCAANAAGAGVFVTVNETNLRGRKASDVQRVRAVFADFDGAPLPSAFSLRPHVIVESSPGKWHVYWFCSIPLVSFRGVQHCIAEQFGSDRAVNDLPRVMRLSGFWHHKAEPFRTRIKTLETHARYSDDEILAAFPSAALTPENTPSRFLSGSRNSELCKLAQLWHRQGRDRAFVLDKLRQTNEHRCEPPLEDGEVRGIADRICSVARNDKVLRPLAFMDSSAYLGLTHSARALLIEAERFAQLQGNGNVALTPSMLSKRGFSAKTIMRGIRALTNAGLLARTREPEYGKQGEHKLCGLYRVTYL